MDWIGEFADDPSLEALLEALRNVSRTDPDVVVLEEALAALEVVAAANGRMSSEVEVYEDIARALSSLPFTASPSLLVLASATLDKVEVSALSDMWTAAEREAWMIGINDLRARLLPKVEP